MRRFLRSFACAARGLWFCLRHERHFRIHLTAAAYVLGFAPYFSLTRGEWAALILLLGVVPAAEAVNTAVEQAVNLAQPQRRTRARVAKDVAAGAVLLLAAVSVVIGFVLFWRPEVFSAILADFRRSLWKPVCLLVSLFPAGWFIAFGGIRPKRRRNPRGYRSGDKP